MSQEVKMAGEQQTYLVNENQKLNRQLENTQMIKVCLKEEIQEFKKDLVSMVENNQKLQSQWVPEFK